MSQPVLITGVAGFIGSHLAQRLLSSGYSVIGMDNFDNYYPVSIKRDNIRLLEKEPDFQLIEGDIRDISILRSLFTEQSINSVIHLAARAGVRPSVEFPLLYQDINVRGTLNLLQECCRIGVNKFIFASSSSVYGINGHAPFNEKANVNHPVSPYAASKASAELFCRTYNHLYGLPVIALRLFTVYGPRQRPEMAIYRFTRQIDKGEEVNIFGDGTSDRDYTYIEDIVDGFMAALGYQGESFQIFNLGRGRTTNLKYLLTLLEKALHKKARIKFADPVPGDVPLTIADITKANILLGYNPQVNIEEGINRFVRWYLNGKEK